MIFAVRTASSFHVNVKSYIAHALLKLHQSAGETSVSG